MMEHWSAHFHDLLGTLFSVRVAPPVAWAEQGPSGADALAHAKLFSSPQAGTDLMLTSQSEDLHTTEVVHVASQSVCHTGLGFQRFHGKIFEHR